MSVLQEVQLIVKRQCESLLIITDYVTCFNHKSQLKKGEVSTLVLRVEHSVDQKPTPRNTVFENQPDCIVLCQKYKKH